MSFYAKQLAIGDVLVIAPWRLQDPPGSLTEIYSRSAFEDLGISTEFVQDNQVFSAKKGTLRGLHFQLAPEPQAKLVRVLAGSIFDVVVDLRTGSPSYSRWCGVTLTADQGAQIFVPRGFAHAYCTLVPNTLVSYKVDGYYNKTVESGIRWDDSDIGIDWPLALDNATISERDRGLPLLRDAETPFRFV